MAGGIGEATRAAWDYEKSLTRIKQSFKINFQLNNQGANGWIASSKGNYASVKALYG